MSIFKKKNNLDFTQIKSVVILETTQLYNESSSFGTSSGWHIGDVRYYDMPSTISPAGMVYTFSITFKNGAKEIYKVNSGTAVCDKLLQFVLDPDVNASSVENMPVNTEQQGSEPQPIPDTDPDFTLGKNQLPQGEYKIGSDIPAGRFDLKVVFGKGSLTHTYANPQKADNKESNFYYLGLRESYENPIIVGINLSEGDTLKINGNVVLEISRTNDIKIEV